MLIFERICSKKVSDHVYDKAFNLWVYKYCIVEIFFDFTREVSWYFSSLFFIQILVWFVIIFNDKVIFQISALNWCTFSISLINWILIFGVRFSKLVLLEYKVYKFFKNVHWSCLEHKNEIFVTFCLPWGAKMSIVPLCSTTSHQSFISDQFKLTIHNLYTFLFNIDGFTIIFR